MKTIRFWVSHRGSPVRLALRDGDRAVLVEQGPDDEGWYCKSRVYERHGYEVFLDWMNDGTDCDGRHSAGGLKGANIYDLHRLNIEQSLLDRIKPLERNHPLRCGDAYYTIAPLWRHVSSRPVYDQFARAMGY